MSQTKIPATPYPWPCMGDINPERTALMVIDMQADFCQEGGYIAEQGIDIQPARERIFVIQGILSAARTCSDMMIIYTREGHRPELVDLPENKRERSLAVCPGIGEYGPTGRILVRGEPGWAIVEELAPAPGDIVIDKPGKGSFYATDLEHILMTCGIDHLILTGLTTDVCVHTTMREANDRGIECLLVEDATMATEQRHHDAIVSMTAMQGGIFGAVTNAAAVIQSLHAIRKSA